MKITHILTSIIIGSIICIISFQFKVNRLYKEIDSLEQDLCFLKIKEKIIQYDTVKIKVHDTVCIKPSNVYIKIKADYIYTHYNSPIISIYDPSCRIKELKVDVDSTIINSSAFLLYLPETFKEFLKDKKGDAVNCKIYGGFTYIN